MFKRLAGSFIALGRVRLELLAIEAQVDILSDALMELDALSVSVEDADADAMANPAIDIKLVGALPVFVCWVNYAFGLMLMLMMPHMLCLSRSAFMHAIGSNRRPAELER